MAPAPPPDCPSLALHTDHYELTMLDASLRSGVAHRRAVFEVFGRSLPPGRRFGVVAGTGRLLEALADFRFGPAEVDWLADRGFLSDEALAHLADYRFAGRIDGYAEGELFFPASPILTVEGDFADVLILETLVLSILNFDSAVAAAAARMKLAAGERSLIEGGSRRTHEAAAVAAARAAWIAGFDVTSNLEASRRYGIPSAGTVAHAFTLAHATEREAFEAQVAAFGPDTTFLVDTFDVDHAIRTAVDLAGPKLGGIRLDSGNLIGDAERARGLLDELGATNAQITASGDLDEDRIVDLNQAPIDRYMVGTALVTGSGAPTAALVYKLVAMAAEAGAEAPLHPVAKRSVGKATLGGRKRAFRMLDREGRAVAEFVTAGDESPPERCRPLQVPLVDGGEVVTEGGLAEARARHRQAMAELRPADRDLHPGSPSLIAGPDAAWASVP